MQRDKGTTEYRAPEIVNLGDAAVLTLGDGVVYSDYLGNPLTHYGGRSDIVNPPDEEGDAAEVGAPEVDNPRRK
jgi:hypothetical protein